MHNAACLNVAGFAGERAVNYSKAALLVVIGWVSVHASI